MALDDIDRAALDMPTANDIHSWGYTVDEFQSLVRRKFDLLMEESRLMEQLTDRPYGTVDGMRHEAIASVQKELFLRRLDPRTQSVESFRQRGTHTRMLQAAERDLFDRLQQKISTLRQRVQIIAESKAPTQPVEPAAQSAPIDPQRTVRATPGAGGTGTPSGSGQSPSTGREPVQPNPNYQGPPLMDDPNVRRPWKPVGAPPAKPPSLAETHGTTISLALANLEGILRCREAEVPARDCLLGLMVGNGIAATMPLAVQLLSAATVVKLTIGVQVLLVGKGAWDSYQFLDGLQGAARGEYDAWLAKRNREDWLRKNMETRDMPGYIAQLRRRIDDTLGPLATNLEAQCTDLWQMATTAAPAASRVAAAMAEMPEKSAILALEPYYDKSVDALANERVLRRDLAGLHQAFAGLGGDDAGIAGFRQSAEDLAGRAQSHMTVEDELVTAKGTLDRAFALMARMRNLSAGAVPYERLESQAQMIAQTRAARAGQADKLRIEVQALKRAFPRQEIETWMEAELLSLDAAIDNHLLKDCNPDDMISTHRVGVGAATGRLQEVENSLEPVDLLHASLSRLDYGTGRDVLAAVQGLLQRVPSATALPEQPPSGDEAGDGGFQFESATVPPASAAEGRADPAGAGSGFTHEHTQVGAGPAGREPAHGTPPAEDGFAHEGTVGGPGGIHLLDTPPGPAPPPASDPQPVPGRQPPVETVTYFDRPWLPQSWQTSGDAKATRAEIYQAASRLGWAAALAAFAPTTADNLVVDHLNATAGHLQRANQASFAPHKAWPDWQRHQQVYGQWIRRLTQGSAASREYFRKGLDGLLHTEVRTLREQLLTQTPRQAGGLSNCDSILFQIGYDLAYAAQVQSIALDGMQAGQNKAWARQLQNKASGSAASAGRNIQEIKPTPQRKGCPDYSVLVQELNQVKSRLDSAVQPELHAVWNKGLALAVGGGASYDRDDLVGEWLIASDMGLSWGNYIKRQPGAAVDPHQSGSVRVRFEKRGSDYVGTIIRQGTVPTLSDAWTYESTGRNRVRVFQAGLEYLHLKKVGQNLFQGTILKVGTPGDDRLSPTPVYIAVYDEAAKLLQQLSTMPREMFAKTDDRGALMLRLEAAGVPSGPDMDAVGRHVFESAEREVPSGAHVTVRRAELAGIGGTMAPSYVFSHQKPFRFERSTDNNPGWRTILHYVGDKKVGGMDNPTCGLSDNLRQLQRQTFVRHGGKGLYCLATHRNTTNTTNIAIISSLTWIRGEWAISMWGMDYPNHAGNQFGGQQGQVNYMFRLLDKWVPRIATLPVSATQPGNRPAPSPFPRPQPETSRGGLLGIEAR